MADPNDAETFVRRTRADALAAAVGSVHGMWADIWPLRLDRVKEIRERTDVPMVLHGSSGILRTRQEAKEKGIRLQDNEGTLQDAVRAGICKVNVATAVSLTFLRASRAAFDKNPMEKDLRKILLPGKEAAKELVKGYLRLFGSSGKGVGCLAADSRVQASVIEGHE
jgi:fructose/tagatose bisphosphate aldolase